MHKSLQLTAGILAATTGSLFSQSVWLPDRAQLIATPGYTYQTLDHYYEGTTRVELPADLSQQTGYVNLEYGILANLAADVTLGYSSTRFAPPGAPKFGSDGLADTQLGLRYRLLDEQADSPWKPALAVRVGGIIAGTYPVSFGPPPVSPSDGASGFEVSLLAGKTFGDSGFGAYADIGYRNRDHDVPDDVFGRVGVFQQVGPVTLGVGYRHVQGLSGGDIGGPGFGTSFGFPQVREIDRLIDGGITFRDKGGRGYQAQVGKTLSGRNTGDKWIFSLAVSLPF